MDRNLKHLGELFQVLMPCGKKHQKKLWSVLPDEIRLISSSCLFWRILWIGNCTKKRNILVT